MSAINAFTINGVNYDEKQLQMKCTSIMMKYQHDEILNEQDQEFIIHIFNNDPLYRDLVHSQDKRIKVMKPNQESKYLNWYYLKSNNQWQRTSMQRVRELIFKQNIDEKQQFLVKTLQNTINTLQQTLKLIDSQKLYQMDENVYQPFVQKLLQLQQTSEIIRHTQALYLIDQQMQQL